VLYFLREYKIWQNILFLRFNELTNLTEIFVEIMRKMQKLSSQLQGRLKKFALLDIDTIFSISLLTYNVRFTCKK